VKALKWISISLAGLIALILIFYAEEDWRGKRAWENCKRELEAKGEILDWNKFIPPPVPDDQNFFAASKMQEWFVEDWHSNTNELADCLQSANKDLTQSAGAATNLIVTAEDAKKYLAWSDQFKPNFDLIREALKLPYARMDGDYRDPLIIPIPNFVTVRTFTQVLSQRIHCYLLLGQSEKALNELTLLNNSRRMLEAAPTGQPTTLVAAMVNVAVVGLYANTIAEDFEKSHWNQSQLATLQNQLEQINLISVFNKSQKSEAADLNHVLANLFRKYPNDPSLWWDLRHLKFPWINWMPRGWIYQNMVTAAKLKYKQSENFDLESETIFPKNVTSQKRQDDQLAKSPSPYSFLVGMIGFVHIDKALQTLTYNQTLVNEAQIACALERYKLANGNYPETLDALAPQFIEKIPHDIIGGEPLHYHRADDGKFILYSVGWNEKDDGGTPGTLQNVNQGDWVWKN